MEDTKRKYVIKEYIMTVKDMDDYNKPREKMIRQGPESLSNQELLTALLGVGTRKEEVYKMATRIFKEYGDKNLSNQRSPKVLKQELGIPESKACQIVACFELGRRFYQKGPNGHVTIRSAKQAFDYLKDMHDLPKEQLRGLYLNSRYKLIHDEVISVGGLTASTVHPREVFGPAVAYSSLAVILAHNHPSGSTQPSQSDIDITENLIKASKYLQIDLLDHIIIAGNKFSSVPADYD